MTPGMLVEAHAAKGDWLGRSGPGGLRSRGLQQGMLGRQPSTLPGSVCPNVPGPLYLPQGRSEWHKEGSSIWEKWCKGYMADRRRGNQKGHASERTPPF